MSFLYNKLHPHIQNSAQGLQKTVSRARNQSQKVEKQKRQSKLREQDNPQDDITLKLQRYCDDFINKKYVKLMDMISLIRSIRDKNCDEKYRIIEKYGMREEYLSECQKFIRYVEYIHPQNYNWSHFEELLIREHREIIQNSTALRQISHKNKIKLIEGKQDQLFNTIQQFGCNHRRSLQVISSSTYPAYREDLHKLCQNINIAQRLSDTFTMSLQSGNPSVDLQYFEKLPKDSKTIILQADSVQKSGENIKDSQLTVKKQSSLSNKRISQQSIHSEGPIQPKIQVNPFKSINNLQESKNIQIVNFLLIFVSADQIKNITVTNQQTKKQLKLVQSKGKHLNLFYLMAFFKVSRRCRYKMQLNFTILKRKQIILNILYLNNLFITVDKDLIAPTNVDATINKALFESIGFILRNVVCKEEEIYAWLRLLNYSYRKGEDQDAMLKIFKKLRQNDLRESKYLLCLFHSIYRENSSKYYIKSSLKTNLKFPKEFFQFDSEYYTLCQGFNIFFLQIHLLYLIEYKDKEKYHNLIKKLLLLNMRHQSNEDLVDLLKVAAEKIPQILMEVSIEFKNVFLERNICAHDYFLIKANYIKYQLSLDQTQSKQEIILIDFIQEMAKNSKKCNPFCHNRAPFKLQEYSDLLIETRFFKNNRSRVSDKNLPLIYSLSKTILAHSQNHMNIAQVVAGFFYQQLNSLIAKYPVQTFMSLIARPISQLDSQSLRMFFKKDVLTVQHIVEIIRLGGQDTFLRYHHEKLEQFLQFYNMCDLEIVLKAVDQLYSLSPEQEKIEYCNRAFKTILKKITIVQFKDFYPRLNSTFSKYMQLYFAMINQNLKRSLLIKIFSQIRTWINDQDYIIDKIHKSFNDDRFNQKQSILITFYLSNREIRMEE